MELFLKNLQVRGCSFHVVFFDNQRELCAPSTAPASLTYKYQMTRTILIQHLRQSANGASGKDDTGLIFSFPSIDSQQFYQHLTRHPPAFLLCHDGHTASGQRTPSSAVFHYMIHQFLQLGHSVALIHSTEFMSSRVCVEMTADPFLHVRSFTSLIDKLTRKSVNRAYDNGSSQDTIFNNASKPWARRKCTKIRSAITA